MNNASILLLFLLLFILSAFMASQTKVVWDRDIEIHFIYATTPPTLLLTFLLLKEARRAYKEYGIIMVNVPALAFVTTLLGLVILLGRYANVVWSGWLYVATHALQDVLQAATATILIMFAISSYTLSKHLRRDLLADWVKK